MWVPGVPHLFLTFWVLLHFDTAVLCSLRVSPAPPTTLGLLKATVVALPSAAFLRAGSYHICTESQNNTWPMKQPGAGEFCADS